MISNVSLNNKDLEVVSNHGEHTYYNVTWIRNSEDDDNDDIDAAE